MESLQPQRSGLARMLKVVVLVGAVVFASAVVGAGTFTRTFMRNPELDYFQTKSSSRNSSTPRNG